MSARTAFCQLDPDTESLKRTQADLLEDRHPLDVMIFPSSIAFNDVKGEWDSATDPVRILRMSVSPIVKSISPERVSIKELQAFASADGHKWQRFDFAPAAATGTWKGIIEIPAAPAVKSTAKSPAANKEKPLPEKTKKQAIVCFRAVDSLGNTTVELFQQTEPAAVEDVWFMPLAEDRADPARQVRNPDYELSPDRDILETSAAWLRDQLFFSMQVAGTTLSRLNIKPALNYYVIRFIPSDTSALNIQLGSGMYHYFSFFQETEDDARSNINSGYPFRIEYDPVNLYQLVEIIKAAKNTPGFPRIFGVYEDMLKQAGMDDALKGNYPAPVRLTVENTGLIAQPVYDKIFWRIDLEAFKKEDKTADVFSTRFYTGYIRTRESSGVIRDDSTGYITILLTQHFFPLNNGK